MIGCGEEKPTDEKGNNEGNNEVVLTKNLNIENVKDVKEYITRIDEMIERKAEI